MGCEGSCNLRSVLFQIQNAATRHPFVELSYHLVACIYVKLVITFDNLCCRISEKARLYVVPASGETVKRIIVPQSCEYFVLLVEVASEIDQYHNRSALQCFPSADAEGKSLAFGILFPRGTNAFVGFKFVCCRIVLANVGTNQDIVASEFVAKGLGFCGYNSVNAANLVANLPTYFKYIVCLFCCHILKFCKRCCAFANPDLSSQNISSTDFSLSMSDAT